MTQAIKDKDQLRPAHLARYASVRRGKPDGMPITMLHVGPEQTIVVSGKDMPSAVILTLEIGSQKTAYDYFKHNPPTAVEMENAIMATEDEVARAQATILGDSMLATNDASIREIALTAGLTNEPVMHLGLAQVETTFNRLVSVLHGRPASTEGLPASREFAATLLILREFMHHLKFSSLAVFH